MKSIRWYYNGFMDWFAKCRVYFFRGWAYMALVMAIINLLTFFIVSDFSKYVPITLPVSSLLFASITVIILIIGSTVFGKLDYDIGTGRREANVNFDLCGKQADIYKMVEEIHKEIVTGGKKS